MPPSSTCHQPRHFPSQAQTGHLPTCWGWGSGCLPPSQGLGGRKGRGWAGTFSRALCDPALWDPGLSLPLFSKGDIAEDTGLHADTSPLSPPPPQLSWDLGLTVKSGLSLPLPTPHSLRAGSKPGLRGGRWAGAQGLQGGPSFSRKRKEAASGEL